MTSTARELLSRGYVGVADAVVQSRETVGDPHSGAGGRGWSLTLAGGLAFEVLPERGLDIGAAWYGGQPIGWRSGLGSPGLAPTAAGWLGRFGGGLLVTCGLDNIGAPRGGYGQHGSHHDTRAHDVAVTRVEGVDGAPGVQITGTVDSFEVFGRRVRLHRTITSFADAPAIHLADHIVNVGAWPASAALLYHVNFGAPLVMPGTRVEIEATDHDLREPSDAASQWGVFPDTVDHITEAVWCHTGLTSVDGVATARVVSPSQLAAEVSWRVAELPRLVQWVFPPHGSWALGIEPSNAPMWGPERDTEAAGMAVLEPGQTIDTSLTIRVTG